MGAGQRKHDRLYAASLCRTHTPHVVRSTQGRWRAKRAVRAAIGASRAPVKPHLRAAGASSQHRGRRVDSVGAEWPAAARGGQWGGWVATQGACWQRGGRVGSGGAGSAEGAQGRQRGCRVGRGGAGSEKGAQGRRRGRGVGRGSAGSAEGAWGRQRGRVVCREGVGLGAGERAPQRRRGVGSGAAGSAARALVGSGGVGCVLRRGAGRFGGIGSLGRWVGSSVTGMVASSEEVALSSLTEIKRRIRALQIEGMAEATRTAEVFYST